MIAEIATQLIMRWCEFDSSAYEKEAKAECAIKLANCAIVKHGVLADDKKLQVCVEQARIELGGKK